MLHSVGAGWAATPAVGQSSQSSHERLRPMRSVGQEDRALCRGSSQVRAAR